MNGGKWLVRGSRALSWGVLAAVVAILALQAAGVWLVRGPSIGPSNIAPSTAVALGLAALSVLLGAPGRSRVARRAADVAAAAIVPVTLVGLLAPRVGVIRPAYNTVCALFLLVAALLAAGRPTRPRNVFQPLALGSALVALLATAGYVYDSPLLYHPFEHEWGMALISALLLLGANGALLASRPGEGLVAPLAGDDVRGRMLRRFLPAVLGIPLFALALELLAESKLSIMPTLAAVLAVAGMALGALLIAAFARRVGNESALEARFASLVEHSSDAVVDTALDGTVLNWNLAATRIYGYAPHEIVGRPVTTVVMPEDRDVIRAMRAAVLRDGQGRVFEGLRIRKDGSTFYASTSLSPIVDGRGTTVGISAISRDLTQRVAAEHAMRRAHEVEAEQRAWIEAVVDQMPEPVVLLDADGSVRQVNRAASGFRTAAEAGGSALLEVRRPDGSPMAACERPLARALRTGQPVAGDEVLLRSTAGEDVSMLASAALVYSPGGERIGAAQVYQDIGPIKQLERERREWTSMVAHDLRQPVTVIGVTARTLRTACAQNERARPQVDRVARAARQLERMITDLLDVAQLEARRVDLRTVPCDLGLLLRETVDDLRDVAPSRPVVLHEEGAPMLAAVDAARFAQVVGNLISNAVKYGAPGTEVRVDLRRDGGRARLSVSNRGAGIPPEELPRLFERFVRTRAARGSEVPGLGLGLFIARELVRAHGGNIWAESVPGESTTFHVELPLLEQSDVAPARAPAAERSLRAG